MVIACEKTASSPCLNADLWRNSGGVDGRNGRLCYASCGDHQGWILKKIVGIKDSFHHWHKKEEVKTGMLISGTLHKFPRRIWQVLQEAGCLIKSSLHWPHFVGLLWCSQLLRFPGTKAGDFAFIFTSTAFVATWPTHIYVVPLSIDLNLLPFKK